ncbi:MAG: UPF0149 family protein [Gammaproteobacteria bacterium]
MKLPDYGELQGKLGADPNSDDAAEAHGTLCGLLCAGVEDLAETWIHNTFVDAEQYSFGRRDDARALLEALHDATAAALKGGEMSFRLLLPDDKVAIEDRAAALAAWCNGFLYGLAIHGLQPMEKLPEEVRELLGDFSEIGRAGVAAEEADEEGEQALVELIEYVRVGAQLVYDECRPRAGYH